MIFRYEKFYSINVNHCFVTGGLDDLVYHLHGYSFYVVGSRQFGRTMSLQEVKKLDKKRQLFSRNLDCALVKDTIIVPKFGAVALRFKADNPGKSSLLIELTLIFNIQVSILTGLIVNSVIFFSKLDIKILSVKCAKIYQRELNKEFLSNLKTYNRHIQNFLI